MRKVLAIFTLITICLTLTSCYNDNKMNQQPQTQTNVGNIIKENEITDSGPLKGGIVRLFSTVPDTLNPILTKNVYVQDFSSFIYESMFKLSKDQKIVALLCDKWNVSSDGLIWSFHIRENVFWSNNTPLTAEDIKYTFDTIVNKDLESVYKKNLDNVALYSAVDSNNFKVILKKPDSFLAEQFTFPIICQNYYLGENLSNLSSKKNMEPVGTGPFKYSTYNGVDTISLVANESWWNRSANVDNELEMPYLSGVDIKIYKNGKDAVTAFQTRNIDATVLPLSDFNKYNGKSDLIIRKFISKNYEFLAFNLYSPIMGDKSVRQAISYSFDKVKMINDIIPGQAVTSDLPIIPDSWLNDTNILFYLENKVKAKEILNNGGWKEEKSGDNFAFFKIIKGVKTQLKFTIIVNNFDDTRLKVAEYIAQQLKDIGINVTISKLSSEAETKAINTRKFDMAVLGYKITSIPDISFAYSTGDILSGFNVSGYSNPSVDSLLEQMKLENDLNRKQFLIRELKNIVNDEVPFIGLYFYNNAIIYNQKLRGIMNPIVWDKFNDITKWYIPVKN